MALIVMDKASLAFGHYLLLDKVNLNIEKGDKIGLIGRNGSGKSSLLKALAGEINLDDGKIHIANDINIVYVPQEPELNTEHTIYAEVLSANVQLTQDLSQYSLLLEQLAQDYTEDLAEELSNIQMRIDKSDGWNIKSKVDKALSELNLAPDLLINSLSGGTKKKVALAKALFLKPDVLLLDEPTNHLDINAIIWLESMINAFAGTVILITHDRYFLDKVVNKIVELDRAKLSSYPGSYIKYQEYKANALLEEAKHIQNFDKVLATEEVWIRKGVEARRTRNEGRVKRLEQLRILRRQRREQLGKVDFKVDVGDSSGKLVVQLEKITIAINDNVIVKDFSAKVMRGDKVGLIGANGIGKSTLLKSILGEIAITSGKIKIGTKVEVAYFDQLREQLDDESPICDVVSQGEDYVFINGRRLHIATYLEEFLFPAERFRSPVKSLSGGERNRLLLARLFSKPANVLVLDEPTNDLDIETLELLEELLINYSGTVFIVSHDRSFLDNVISQAYVFTGEAKVFEFAGSYSEYIEYSKAQVVKVDKDSGISTKTTGTKNEVKPNASKLLSYKEKQLLIKLPDMIIKLEQEAKELQELINEPDIHKNSPLLATEYLIKLSQLEEKIVNNMQLWEDLEHKSNLN